MSAQSLPSFAAMRDALRSGNAVQAVSAPDLYSTPTAVIERIFAAAEDVDGLRVLEPSAGMGAIVAPLIAYGATVTAVEISAAIADGLSRRYGQACDDRTLAIHTADFLDLTPGTLGMFDSVVMNPPFGLGRDRIHVRHAWEFLRPDGELIAVMADGASFESRQRACVEFRAWLEHRNGWSETLPAESFRAAGTSVRTRLVVVPGPGPE